MDVRIEDRQLGPERERRLAERQDDCNSMEKNRHSTATDSRDKLVLEHWAGRYFPPWTDSSQR